MNTQPKTMSGEEAPRNPADYAVLGILALGPAHGYDVFRRMNEGLEAIWRLGRSQVYALLRGLEKEGLVQHQRIYQETLPPKKIFSLSPAGNDVLFSWLCTPVNNVRDLRLEFLGKLYFVGLICPENKETLVSDQLAVCHEKLNDLSKVMQECNNPLELQALNFKLVMTRAAAGWLEGFLEGADL